MLIRTCTRSDCEAVTALNRELGYDATEAEIASRLATLLASPHQTVLVAVDEARVVGWIYMAVIHTLETEIFAEIRGLIVTESLRGAGIGALLVAAGEEWARSHDLTRVRVRSNIKRERTRGFYERLGYRVVKTQNVFDRDLGRG